MSPAEEDALVREHQLRSGDPVEARIRFAIRAAVAAERERCAEICENHRLDIDAFGNIDYHVELTREQCAAAIRRGDD